VNFPRFVFIVGFERCMTTSLATYVRAVFDCDLLVHNVKEPHIFTSDPQEAMRILGARTAANPGTRLFLDASTSYLPSPDTLRAIAGAGIDYRVIVCLRDQFDRTLSAYKYYRRLMTIAIEDCVIGSDAPPALAALAREPRLAGSYLCAGAACYYRAFGRLPTDFSGPDLGLWMAQGGDGVPAKFMQPPPGRYSGTHIMNVVLGRSRMTPDAVADSDRECGLLAGQSFPARVLYELRRLRSQGSYPSQSVLGNSYFAPMLEGLFEAMDPARVLLLSMEAAAGSPQLAAILAKFVDCRPVAPQTAFPKSNDTSREEESVPAADRRRAELLLRNGFAEDTAGVRKLVARLPRLQHALLDPGRLHAGTARAVG
jgi:hypothetical protein